MKRFVVLAIAICCATPAIAQQPPDPIAVVAQVLGLSSDQIAAWSDILHSRQAALEPLAQTAQAQQQAIGQAIAGANPDPLTIGKAVIAFYALQMQIAVVNAQSAAQFEKILTPDQLQRLNSIRGAAQTCPIIPAFQATGLLGG